MTNFRIKYTSDTSEMSKVKLYNASLVLFKIFVQFCSIYLVHGQFHKKDNEIPVLKNFIQVSFGLSFKSKTRTISASWNCPRK